MRHPLRSIGSGCAPRRGPPWTRRSSPPLCPSRGSASTDEKAHVHDSPRQFVTWGVNIDRGTRSLRVVRHGPQIHCLIPVQAVGSPSPPLDLGELLTAWTNRVCWWLLRQGFLLSLSLSAQLPCCEEPHQHGEAVRALGAVLLSLPKCQRSASRGLQVAPVPVTRGFGRNGAEISHSRWALSKSRTPGSDSRIQS